MKKLVIAAALVIAGTSAALAQGYVYDGGAPSVYVGRSYQGYVYDYVPAYTGAYYDFAPGYWYGADDESGNSVRQPSPSSTIRAVR